MKTIVTSKYQITIPKKTRDRIGLSVHDTLEWEFRDGKVVVRTIGSMFLKFRNTVRVGPGDISSDIKLAREKWAK